MKRTVERSKRLPAFQLDLRDLQLLAQDVAALFGPENPSVSFTLYLKGEHLTFGDFNELECQVPKLPGNVLRFDVHWWDVSGRECYLPGFLLGSGTTSVRAPDEAWCAGVLAIVAKHAHAHKRWYARLVRRWEFGLLWAVAGSMPMLLIWVFDRHVLDTAKGAAWFVGMFLIATLYLGFGRLFPPMRLVIRKDENWLRRNATELTLALSFVSLVISLVALLAKT